MILKGDNCVKCRNAFLMAYLHEYFIKRQIKIIKEEWKGAIITQEIFTLKKSKETFEIEFWQCHKEDKKTNKIRKETISKN